MIAEVIKNITSELPASVKLIAVSKFHPVEAVMEAYLSFCNMSDRIPKAEDGTAQRENWLSICRLDMLTADGISLGDLGEALP